MFNTLSESKQMTIDVEQEYFDLGNWHRQVTTSADSAQIWFNRGLAWLYGFNHDEAIICFERAIQEDKGCVMAYWGLAYSIGPNYNKIWEIFGPEERELTLATAHQAIADGLALGVGTPVEIALLEALNARYPDDPATEEYGPYNDAFVEAMRPIYLANTNDLDIASVFAESLMGRTPWQLWDLKTGTPKAGSSTQEARQVLEDAFQADPAAWSHPGLLHMYIHLMEMSPTPELALPHGDHLATLVPDSGHLVHMATHIDVLCGEYPNVIYRNHKAAQVDQPFTELRGAENFYTVYRIHNVHFEAYGAMFLAQKDVALTAADELRKLLPETTVAFMPDLFEAFWGMRIHVLVRFGQWQTLLEEPIPEDAELFSFTTALVRYGRVIALANLNRHQEAAEALDLFFAAQLNVPESRFMFNNPAIEVLKVAAEMAQGELHYKAGDTERGLDHLRQATKLSDELVYDEPWGWMQPPRHALAALLMEQQEYEEAESIYRADLGLTDDLARPHQHPGNVWALHGLNECLERRGETNEIAHIRIQLDRILARADVAVGASCFCRSA
ncbi:MAG: tetratricopeptide repeat protein [Pseudomonadota bacterium]